MTRLRDADAAKVLGSWVQKDRLGAPDETSHSRSPLASTYDLYALERNGNDLQIDLSIPLSACRMRRNLKLAFHCLVDIHRTCKSFHFRDLQLGKTSR